MIIGACGYGATGSSIITDLLREYDGIQVFDDIEFTYTYRVDGLEDLEYHLTDRFAKGLSSDAAIKRFIKNAKSIKIPFIHKPTDSKTYLKIVDKYINSITQVRFRGMTTIDTSYNSYLHNIIAIGMKKIILPRFIEKWKKQPSYIWPNREMYLSVMPENFYDASREYIRDILSAMGADLSKTIALDQPFEANAPENSFKFFDDPKAIIVDRDPRDLYLEAKHTLIAECRFLPRSNVKEFVEYYRQIRKKQPTTDKDNVIVIRFEDLIYHYDESIARIEQFCKLGNHTRKKEYFNPKRSVNNTQLIRKYPNDIKAIKYIEEELKEYLFPYEKYQDVDTSGKVFVGSAKYNQK